MEQSKHIAVEERPLSQLPGPDNDIGKDGKNELTATAEGKGYDLSDLYLMSNGDEKFVEKMINIFIDHMPAQVAKMEEHYKQQHYKAVGAVAHAMKPAIDSMGIFSLKTVIREIEMKGKNGVFDDTMIGLITTLSTTIYSVVNLLKAKFKS